MERVSRRTWAMSVHALELSIVDLPLVKWTRLRPTFGVRPCGWTVLINYFDRLLGMLIFELRGAEIAQRRI